jgi:hypothetical protein
MTHFYDKNDRDCYYCDGCGNVIIGDVYNKHGKIPVKKPKFWNNDEHYCNYCINNGA